MSQQEPQVQFTYEPDGFLKGWHYTYRTDSTDGKYEFISSSGPFRTRRSAEKDYHRERQQDEQLNRIMAKAKQPNK